MTPTATAQAECKVGLEQQFADLYRSNCADIYAYVATLLRDRAAAEDVTAITFERAYRKRSSYKQGRGSARGWLFGIARNAALDELRNRKRSAPLELDVLDEAAPSPIEAAELALRRATVRNAVDALAARERELVALKFHAGLTNAEIADLLRVSESNVGTMLHRTITKLRKACDETSE